MRKGFLGAAMPQKDIVEGRTWALKNEKDWYRGRRKDRRGKPLMLPPPLELGFRVTAEDLDLEKEAAFQCINSVLRGEAKAIWDCRPSRPSHTLSSLATGTCGLSAVSKAPRMDAQQERDKSQDSWGPMAPP
ncbi:hypothetical protein H8959_007010 [Pygathrix nigripes]